LNLRPSGYEPDELPDCSTPRQIRGQMAEVKGQTKAGSGLGSEARRDGRRRGAGGRRRSLPSDLCVLPSAALWAAGRLARPGDDPLSHP
jgi:hypothetical protein